MRNIHIQPISNSCCTKLIKNWENEKCRLIILTSMMNKKFKSNSNWMLHFHTWNSSSMRWSTLYFQFQFDLHNLLCLPEQLRYSTYMKYYKGVQSTYLCSTLTLFSISTKMHSILIFFVAANGLEWKDLYLYASTSLYVSLLFYSIGV